MGNGSKKNKIYFSKTLKNRFFLVSLFFVIWILFIDNYSFLAHRTINKEVTKLKQSKAYFKNEIRKDKEAIKSLKNSDATEKYAREKYYMKRENEAIYIIEFDTLPHK